MGEHRKVPIPFARAPLGHCAWCGEPILHGRRDRRWHDGRQPPREVLVALAKIGTAAERELYSRPEPDCKREYWICSSVDGARWALKREGRWYCPPCGRPAESLREPTRFLYANGERRESLSMAVWRTLTVGETEYRGPVRGYEVIFEPMMDDPMPARRWRALSDPFARGGAWPWESISRQLGLREQWETPFEVDHIVPLVDAAEIGLSVWERFGLPNLQALCPAHHKRKTAREAGERARGRATTRRSEAQQLTLDA